MTATRVSNLQLFHSCRYASTLCQSPKMTIFCDFDGPIVDVSDRYYSTYQLALTDTQLCYQTAGVTLPIQILSKDQFWQMKQDRIADVEIAMRSGLRGEEIDLFLEHVCA